MEFLVSVFGPTGALWAKVGIALLFVLALILLAFWVFRALKGVGMGIGSLRGRLPRLAVLDYADVDSRRRLVLIRRDNVEHLLLLGGPTDVVVETNILRVPQAVSPGPAGREAELPGIIDPAAAGETSSRLSPRELARLAAGEPALRAPEEATRPIEAPARPLLSPRAEPLAAGEPAMARPAAAPRATPPFLSAGRPRPEADPVAASRVPPPRPAAPAPSVSPDLAPPMASTPGGDLPPPVKPAYVPPPRVERPASGAGTLSERLDAALKKPISPFGDRKPADAPAAPASEAQPLPVPPAPSPAPPPQAPTLSASEKSVFDSLEEEMASLLGRGPKGS